ncbi:phage tail tape measure protein [Paenibacillus sp. JMULE4]|uniref:phage tail tape measure protein n=1 Tax=Paenibacillus sp. JMULE4 TaxID=2518342 RepID=UPI0015760568|nr:phage tail tape measure protein [Paenibacillus sp. JMULE4]NTZ20938.1 phage tail tape measure protein [Paenibacillus sp. JMULE4]
MAETIKGINVVIGAETSGLSAALSDVNKRARDIQSELKQVDKLLKLDPTNTELVAQKQQLLSQAVENTREKLNRLKSVQEQVNEQFQKGQISEGQYRAFQREVAKTEAELRNLEDRLSDVTTELGDQSGFVKKLGKDYQESFEQAKQSLGNTFEQAKKLGAGMTAAGAAIAAGLGVAVKGAADFEQGMANVYSVMAPDEVAQFKDELKDLAVTMGAQTKYSATEAARGIEELVKAGVSVQDILNGGLSGALSLATAGELELADAAEIASTALNAFKDDAITVQQAADILAGAANASATSVGELKFGLSQVSAVASGVGLSFEDTVTALAAFAQNGLKGSDAGTALKTMLMRLTPTTDDAAAEFERLGLYSFNAQKALQYLAENGVTPASTATKDIVDAMMTYSAELEGVKVGTDKANKAFNEMAFNSGAMSSAFYDSNGNLKSMAEIADILQNALKGMTAEQRQVTLNTLFGSDAIRAANILYKEGADGIKAMAEAMGKISAEDVAAQKMNTFRGALEELSGSVETAQISIGTALIPALRMLVSIVQSVVDVFNSFPPSVQTTIAIIGAIVSALALITGPLLLLIGFIPQIVAGFAMLTPVLSAVGAAFTTLTGPVGLAIAAIVAGAALIIANWDSIKDFFVGLWDNISSATSTAWEAITSGLSATWEAIKNTTSSVFEGIATFFTDVWSGIVSFLTDTWNGLKSVAQTAFAAIIDVIRPIMDGFRTFFSGVWEAIKNIFGGALLLIIDLVTGDFENLKKDAEAIWNNLKEAFGDIWDGIKQVFSGALDLISKALSAAWSGIKSAAESAWNGIQSAISTIITATSTWIKDTWNTLLDWFRELPSKLYTIGSDMFTKMRDAVISTVATVKDAIVTGITAAIDWVRELPSTMLQLGKDMIQGFVNGIKNMAGAVGEAVKGIADRVTGGLRDFLDIRSPSRVLMRLGEYTGEGFARGIGNSITDVRQKAADMAATAADVLSGTAAPTAQMAGVSGSGGAAVYNFEGMFAGAVLQIRNENDIEAIARAIFNRASQAQRSIGGIL